MDRPIKIRSSKLGLAILCPPSMSTGIAIDSADEAADLGTATHEYMASHIGDTHVDIADLAAIHNVDADELGMLCHMASACWEQVHQFFPYPVIEVPLSTDEGGLTLTGTIDVASLVGDQVRVLDWKTGRVDSDHEAQIKAYCLLGLRQNPSATNAAACVVRVRDRIADWGNPAYRWTREQLDDWFRSVAHRLQADPAPYNPGAHCGHCQRRIDCPVFTASARQTMELFLARDEVAVMSNDAWIRLVESARFVAGLAEQAQDLARAEIEGAGPIVGSDGRQLVLDEQERRSIKVAAGWAILKDRLREEHVLPLLKISKTEAVKLVREQAGRGQKKQVEEQFMADLEAAGAIETSTVTQLRIKRGAVETPGEAKCLAKS